MIKTIILKLNERVFNKLKRAKEELSKLEDTAHTWETFFIVCSGIKLK